MTRFLKILSLALVMLAGSLWLPAQAQSADPAVQQIQGFYDALLDTMKHGAALGVKGRYDKLAPAVEQAYDLPGMTAAAVGPDWSDVSPGDRKTLIDAFTRMTVANYAKNFDSFHGEKFTVDPTPVVRGSDHYVKSALQPGSGGPIAFTYRMHQVDGVWKIYDVLLTSENISQLAQKRSDFSATFSTGGAQGLAKKINALADQMLR